MSIAEITALKDSAPVKPPKQGSFPLDHFQECKHLNNEYLACLRRNSYDNISCRYLSKRYLECRMEHDLMYKQPLRILGFTGEENEEVPSRKYKQQKIEQIQGFVPGKKIFGSHSVLEHWRIVQFYRYMQRVIERRQLKKKNLEGNSINTTPS